MQTCIHFGKTQNARSILLITCIWHVHGLSLLDYVYMLIEIKTTNFSEHSTADSCFIYAANSRGHSIHPHQTKKNCYKISRPKIESSRVTFARITFAQGADRTRYDMLLFAYAGC